MLLVRYRLGEGDTAWRAGMLRGASVVDISPYVSGAGRSSSSVRDLLPKLDEVTAWATQQFARGEGIFALDTVELGPPVPDPEKILCLGVNYREHAAEAEQAIPTVPVIFARTCYALQGKWIN